MAVVAERPVVVPQDVPVVYVYSSRQVQLAAHCGRMCLILTSTLALAHTLTLNLTLNLILMSVQAPPARKCNDSSQLLGAGSGPDSGRVL